MAVLFNSGIVALSIFLINLVPYISASSIDAIGLFYLVNYHFPGSNNRSHRSNRSSTAVAVPRNLMEGTVDIVLFNVSSGDEFLVNEENGLSDFYAEQVIAESRNPRVAKVINASFFTNHGNLSEKYFNDPSNFLTSDNGQADVALRVQISGHSIGKTVIDVSVVGYKTGDSYSNSTPASRRFWKPKSESTKIESRMLTSFDVSVVRRTVYKKLGFAFTIIVAAVTIFTTFLIGTKLDWKIVLKEIKKPKSLLIGVGFEFTLMPLIAFAWAMLILRGNYGWQLVYLAIGACPGGGHSPFWTMMLDGNLDLAVAMSFVASVSALGILPFWVFTLGRIFYAGRFTIPYLLIVGSLFGLVCPIFFGLLLKHFRPVLAERVSKIVKHVTVVSFIVLGTFGCAVNSYVFALLDWRHLVCGFLLPWCGYAITYILARFPFRRTHQDSIAIAVENGCLNVAVPTVLIQLTLSQPEADLSLVVPVGVVIFASWPLWFYFIFLVVKKRMAMPTLPLQIPPSATPIDNGAEERERSRGQPRDDSVTDVTTVAFVKERANKVDIGLNQFDASSQTGSKSEIHLT